MICYTEKQAVRDYVIHAFINSRARLKLYGCSKNPRWLEAAFNRTMTLTERMKYMGGRYAVEITPIIIEVFDQIAEEYNQIAAEEREKDNPNPERIEEVIDMAVEVRDQLFQSGYV